VIRQLHASVTLTLRVGPQVSTGQEAWWPQNCQQALGG